MDVPREGDRIAGKYVVERVLGEGGMGVVVAARHEALDQRVAIKFLLPHVVSDPMIVERFAREARAAAKIQSAHVARVIDVGIMDDGAPYMVMEYLEGEDVETYIERKGPLEIADAVGIVIEACEAIAEAHMASIVHRDLKPANLFLARTPGRRIVKVLDFGISKFSSDTKGPKTQTGGLLGTPYYMSPEQLTDTKNVDARSDIWTLGIILYQLLSGGVPFHGETMPEVVGQILKNMPGGLREVRPDVSEALDLIILKCMSSNPAHRFADVGELVTALAPFAPGSQAHVDAVNRALTGMSGPPSTQIGDGATLATGSVQLSTGSALEVERVRRSDRPASAGTLGAVASLEGPRKSRSSLPYVVMALAAATVIGVVAFALGKNGNAGPPAVASTASATVTVTALPPQATTPVSAAVATAPPSAVPSVAPAVSASAIATAHFTATTATPASAVAPTHATATAIATAIATATATTTATATATANPMNMGLK